MFKDTNQECRGWAFAVSPAKYCNLMLCVNSNKSIYICKMQVESGFSHYIYIHILYT